MVAEAITAVLGGAALSYSLGRLLRAHLRERGRERELAQRAEDLDSQAIDTLRGPVTLSAFQAGYLAGLVGRRSMLKEQAGEQRTAAHSR